MPGLLKGNTEDEDKNVVVPTPVRVDVSRFIPRDEIHPIDTDDEQAHSLYSESFIQNCRLEHMVMVMGLHPQYLQQFLDTNVHLLQSSGALSYEYRSYIAIMAAARHQCTYLVHLMEAQFLLQGGNREWLKGLDHIPAKLRALSKLNRLLAHRPWLVTAQDFKDLTEGDAASRWQHSQLAQAVVLLCHFHGLAIFCHGTGVNLELDHSKAHSFHTRSGSPTTPRSKPTSGSNTPVDFRQIEQIGDVEVLMERMRKLQEEEEDVTTEERNRRFEIEKEEASYSLIPGMDIAKFCFLIPGASGPVGGAAYFARYVEDPQFSYQDFAKRDAHAEIPTFRAQDYNWDHAFTVMTGYYGEVAELLDEKYKTAYNLTYKTLATRDNVDTTSLRRAIWMYVHCMYGIMYDDYNYSEVNQLLERPLKVFIKTVSCFPEKTTQAVYDGFWKQFRHSEKVHVNIMLLEARMQVGLLYGLRALTQCMRES
uniref:Uncharacterized protein n=1 Tax=Ciona intestinalis TaxID=7719 RepID=F6T7E5_CIOIN